MLGNTLRSMIIIAVFAVTSFVLGLVKFGGTGSIALDAFPGYFVAAFFSPLLGGIVALLGHILSAAVAGFPLGSAHILISLTQFSWAFIFGFIPKMINNIKFIFVSAVAVVFLNGYVSPVLIGFFYPEMKSFVLGLIPILTLASAINVSFAVGAVFFMRRMRRFSP